MIERLEILMSFKTTQKCRAQEKMLIKMTWCQNNVMHFENGVKMIDKTCMGSYYEVCGI